MKLEIPRAPRVDSPSDIVIPIYRVFPDDIDPIYCNNYVVVCNNCPDEREIYWTAGKTKDELTQAMIRAQTHAFYRGHGVIICDVGMSV